MACVNCTSVINVNEQYYVAENMGSEIISVIERSLGHQIDENGLICSQCFDILIQNMSSGGALADEDEHELWQRHDSNVCVRCRTSLFRRRSHSISEGAERHYIAETIAPREIPEGGLLCFACWVHTQRTIQQQGIRGRIKSRHSSGRTYYTYILVVREGSSWDDKIISYYCSCISGKRTVGCCAHTMTIVWYLGWARYQESIEAPASFLDGVLLRDDIEENE